VILVSHVAPRVTEVNERVCSDTVAPCLEFDVKIEGFRGGIALPIPLDCLLYSADGKLLGHGALEFASFFGSRLPAIVISVPSEYSYSTSLRCKVLLDNKAISYIEERRRTDEYHEVKLKLKFRFLEFYSSVHNEVYKGETLRAYGLPHDAIMLKVNKPLLYVHSLPGLTLEKDITISGSRWVKDFLPALGIGKFLILEIPLPEGPKLPGGALDHFIRSVESLETARKVLYLTLDVGSTLTALRNALIEACQALKPLGLASEKETGCKLEEQRLEELLGGELAELVKEVYTIVKKIATAGPLPTQPHIAPKQPPTLYQVESLIGLVAFTLKLIADTLKYKQTSLHQG